MMADEPTQTSEEIDSELLTAYLDGELSDSDCITVEKRLAEEPAFHRLMCELQNAWDMLDSLPLVQPNSHFVRTTVEMAIAGHKPKSSNAVNIIFFGLMLLLIPASLFSLSYFLKREAIEQPERELVADLPLIENYDRYKQVVSKDNAQDGISLLKSIYSKGLFREVDDLFPVDSQEEPPSDFNSALQPPDPQRIKDRNDRLSRMTDQERAELFDRKSKFEALDANQQLAIREFHDLLAKEPDRGKLVEVMSSYYDWLKIIGMSQRANLLDLPLDQRLTEIRRITRQQAQDNFGAIGSTKLPLDDSILFYQWYDVSIHYLSAEIRERTGEILAEQREAKGLPANELAIDRIKSGPIEQLVKFLLRTDRQNIGQILCENSTPKSFGLDYLRGMVSEEARSIIDQPGFGERDRQELILKWIETANRARFPIKRETLERYFNNLSQNKRDELNNLHPENWDDTLSRMYWNEKIGERSEPSEDEAFQKFLRQSGWETEFGGDDR